MSQSIVRDLYRAEQALGEAMELALWHAARSVAVEYKDSGSPVTEADRAVDELLRSTLPEEGDAWLSEETPDADVRLQRDRVWVVDPIDGTSSFVAGRSDYSISIGLLVGGQPVLGAIGAPAQGVTITGGVGLGVTVTGSLDLEWPSDRGSLRVLASRSEVGRGDWKYLDGLASVYPVGSVAYELALVAGGYADGTWTRYPKHEWDVAAGAALVLAAGGDIWLPRGGHMRWNRSSPRFLSFAAAGAGKRDDVDRLIQAKP